VREATAAIEPCKIMDAVISSLLPPRRGEQEARRAAAISED